MGTEEIMTISKRIMTFGVCAFSATLLAMTPSGEAAETGKNYFKGKAAKWIVATAPGGGFDYYARLIGRFLPKHMGVPGYSIVIVNRAGAGHTIGTNLVYSAKPNGLTIGSFTTNLVYAQIIKRRGVRFDLGKMSWIGKAAADTRMLMVAYNSPLRTFADVVASKRPLKFAASGVGSGSYMEAYLVGAAFNIPQRVIPGFGNQAATLAMMRGELDAQMSNSTEAEAWAQAKQGRVVMQLGPNVDPIIPNGADLVKTPQGKTIVALLVAQAQLARVTAGPPNIPADRLQALRYAYGASLADPALLAEATKAKFPIDPLVGDAVRDKIVAALKQPPEVVALLHKLATIKVVYINHTGPVTKLENGGRKIYINHKGQDVWAKVSGSRTTVMVGGKAVKRKAVKVGMKCTFTYVRPNAEAKTIACK
jgi:tripartite-type tricarboxylate transporter receptor subunit TctC